MCVLVISVSGGAFTRAETGTKRHKSVPLVSFIDFAKNPPHCCSAPSTPARTHWIIWCAIYLGDAVTIERAIDAEPGYFCGLSLSPDELTRVRAHIARGFLSRIVKVYPKLLERFRSIELDLYHELSDLIDHRRLWTIEHRILDHDAVNDIRTMSIMRSLEVEFGAFDIADAENAGRENIVWRIVRPGASSDVGPTHADAWFWELGHGRMPPGAARRIKVWLAVYCELGMSGLRVVPDSHKRLWPYHGDVRDGVVKPMIDVDENDLACETLDLMPGQAVVFHDQLLHRGAPGTSRTRISLEFTILTRRS